MKKGDWTAVFCILIEGTLFFYKSSTDPDPKGSFDLKDFTMTFTVEPSDSKAKKKNTFQINKEKKTVFEGALSSPDDLNGWKTALEAAKSKAPGSAPDRSGMKAGKASAGMKVKKAAASKTANSAVGKKVMKAIVNDETTTLINALKALVTVESGSPKKADEMEKNIIKIAVKAYILVDNKDIKGEQFLVADKPLRDAFNLLVKVFNGRGRAKKERVIEALQRVEADLKKAEKVITELLQPYISAKNMFRLSTIFSTVANLKFLETVFYNDTVESELEKLVDAMDYYTQFHYT
jgi:hypothetical protein